MVEKMTAVWLIILTILVCAAVPGLLIWLTSASAPSAPSEPSEPSAPAEMLLWFEAMGNIPGHQVLH